MWYADTVYVVQENLEIPANATLAIRPGTDQVL